MNHPSLQKVSRIHGLPSKCLLSLLLTALSVQSPAARAGNIADDDEPGIRSSGDVLQWALPAVAYGFTFLFNYDDDYSGSWDASLATPTPQAPGLNWPGPRLNTSPKHDFLVSLLRMETSVYALKYTVNAQRPNGKPQSFPSGHTASAFMGAEFIRKHYGWGWGIPAYGAAALVGYSRVESRNHYWRDVLVGAAIGVAANHDFDAVQTPLGELSFAPTFSANQPADEFGATTSSCGHNSSNKLALIPGMQLTLRF